MTSPVCLLLFYEPNKHSLYFLGFGITGTAISGTHSNECMLKFIWQNIWLQNQQLYWFYSKPVNWVHDCKFESFSSDFPFLYWENKKKTKLKRILNESFAQKWNVAKSLGQMVPIQWKLGTLWQILVQCFHGPIPKTDHFCQHHSIASTQL